MDIGDKNLPLPHAGAAVKQKSADEQVVDLAIARDVLKTEAAALTALGESLGAPFCDAVNHLFGISGRVVVTGMGKSGHVARKIAATLASTGSPALFVHPAEAAHGDLGMIIPGDAVIALSNSGEATELAAIIAHARRIGLKLIGITSVAESTLGTAADIALILPNAPEAGPIGLAPTTSTTMQMALGDALAVVLLARRGFSAKDFRDIHPGGKLGARLKRVRDLMHKGDELPLVNPGTTMDRALITMTAKRFGSLAVVDDQHKLLGIVTDGDLRRNMGPDLLGKTVDEIMNVTPKTIGPDALAEEALREMNMASRPFTALFVVDEGKMVRGILHIHDLLRSGLA
ncbi:MAG: KpsF/GutQ family sugar-phosphate isomerase [Acidocella sp. 20-57-95]|nr:MAG: KpsF/GutQ family sugar-phosphate isomerase [Acidocella sp. 20-57-95]OYV61204.1 MAG: KpsF/GutQ family sugar-phosphate isomerase [Acidocella sp. 21-58-7]